MKTNLVNRSLSNSQLARFNRGGITGWRADSYLCNDESDPPIEN